MHGQQALRRAEGADHAFARRRNGPSRHRPIRGFVEGSEAFAQPSSDPCHVTARSCHQLPRTPRFEVFEMRCLWVDKQACRHRKGRPFSRFGETRPAPPRKGRPFTRFGQTSHAQGTTYSYGTPQDARGEISESVELARTARQHDAAAWLCREGGRSQPITHHLEDFLDPGLDDAHKRCSRDKLRGLALLTFHRWYRDHVPFIRSPR